LPEVVVTKPALANVLVFSAAVLLFPSVALAQLESNLTLKREPPVGLFASAQQSVPPAQQVEAAVTDVIDRFRIGFVFGVGLDPELIQIGAHGAFGPFFSESLEFRPGIEFGFGEVTTIFGINLDAIFMFGEATDKSRWVPYVGGGPNFSIRNRGFTESAEDTEEDGDSVEGEDGEEVDEPSRFDFSDTDFTAGFNFIAGARRANGMFFEMKATAYGISNIRLLVGFNF
jgi:hypothetical protein